MRRSGSIPIHVPRRLPAALACAALSAAALLCPSPGRAQSPPDRAPARAPAAPNRTRNERSATIEGTYAVEGGVEVRVTRLVDDLYRLSFTDGWEGVGILKGSVYRGIFHHPDAPEEGAMGVHRIDWTDARSPTALASSPDGGETTQRWRRLPDVVPPRAGSGEPLIRVAPLDPEELPEFGEYVYVEELPEALAKVPPAYPDEARAAGISGAVVVQALVRTDGTVGDTRVVKSIPGLDDAAVAAVRQWRFKPALAKSKPVAVWVAVPLRFPPDAPAPASR
jgi:TonB family protein